MLGHYTNRIHEIYPELPDTFFRLDTHLAASRLLFMLSGFVVFLSWERGKNPVDFIKARFSRLFPAFWASVLFTFAVIKLFDLPGREIGFRNMLVNLTMVPKFFEHPAVDGAYWTLQIQLFFFASLFLIALIGGKKKFDWILLSWLSFSFIYVLVAPRVGFAESDYAVKLEELLNLPYMWIFACGILLARWQQTQKWQYLAQIGFALGIGHFWVGKMDALACGALCVVLWLACNGRLTFLHHKWLLSLASISYCLYLVHQNFGYVIIRGVVAKGGDIHLGIGLAIAASVAVSILLTYGIEQPAAKWLQSKKRVPAAVAVTIEAPTTLPAAVHYHGGRRHLELG